MESKNGEINGFILGDYYVWELGADGYFYIKKNDFGQTNIYDLMEDIED